MFGGLPGDDRFNIQKVCAKFTTVYLILNTETNTTQKTPQKPPPRLSTSIQRSSNGLNHPPAPLFSPPTCFPRASSLQCPRKHGHLKVSSDIQ